ncbi:Ac45/VOA1 transmembrane domain-containing protein [Aspergillus lucknowensis]|uniref:Protein BIG1 n=1 Tax=Aspergillus lucknowensis TaxID=176173 RepID=A0ABR4L932_9EURO
MRLSYFSLLALGAATTNAFRDTSPFFLASTSEIPSASAQLKSATSLLNDLSAKLSTCPSDYYVIAVQPGVHSTDFTTSKSAPRLGAKMTGRDKSIQSTTIINEVAGVLEAKQIGNILESECGAHMTVIDASSGLYPTELGSAPGIIVVEFSSLPLGPARDQQLSDNDGLLSDIVGRLPSSKYTILYLTTPREFEETSSPVYQPKNDPYQDPMHVDLKRDYSAHSRRQETTNNSLFDEYQYFTPGLFMGLIAGFFFLAILYVAFSALLSLQVPYAAFEKDTSASEQKKHE